MSEKFTFFWHGPFSQWYRQDFVVEGVTYNCAEQYMMAAKAKLFEDKCKAGTVKLKVLRTLAGKYQNIKHHSWRMWKALDDIVKAALTGLQISLHNLKELCVSICDEGENLSSEIFLSELIAGSGGNNSIQAKERSPSKLLQVW